MKLQVHITKQKQFHQHKTIRMEKIMIEPPHSSLSNHNQGHLACHPQEKTHKTVTGDAPDYAHTPLQILSLPH